MKAPQPPLRSKEEGAFDLVPAPGPRLFGCQDQGGGAGAASPGGRARSVVEGAAVAGLAVGGGHCDGLEAVLA